MVKAAANSTTTTSTIDTSQYNYVTLRLRGKDGKLHYVRGNNDAVFRAMALHTIINGKEAMQVARANKLDIKEHTNTGQERMAIGNMLRRLVKSQPVTIGDVIVKDVNQKQPVLKSEDAAAARPAAKKGARPARRKAAAAMEDAAEAS